MTNIDNRVTQLLEEIQRSKNIVVVSGAGISVAAGFPTFVDAKTGRYKASTKNDFDANVVILTTLASKVTEFHQIRFYLNQSLLS
jgi:NAD-dependent SIR2 family protein deacetylase